MVIAYGGRRGQPGGGGEGLLPRAHSQVSWTGHPMAVGAATLGPASVFSSLRSQQAETSVAWNPGILLLQPTNTECPLAVFLLCPGAGQPAHGQGGGAAFLGSVCRVCWPHRAGRAGVSRHCYLKQEWTGAGRRGDLRGTQGRGWHVRLLPGAEGSPEVWTPSCTPT